METVISAVLRKRFIPIEGPLEPVENSGLSRFVLRANDG